ncbi:MAG: hypothetical protein RLZZ381_174, partial [Cyanobacteriota bacterium]
MTRTNWIIIGLAYIIGLLSTNVIIDSTSGGLNLQRLAILSVILLILAVVMAIILIRVRLTASPLGQALLPQRTNRIVAGKIKTHVWIVAAIVAIFAVVYFQLRIPQPKYNDISYQISKSDRPLVRVIGTVLNEPRLNDRQRLKFWLKVAKIDGETVSGKLYATLPLLQGTGIYPGQQLNLTGFLYLPPPATNANGFDFKQYLARQGIFAGIQGTEAEFKYDEPGWGWWKLRQRIVWSHLQGLGSPVGQLVSSMVLGSKAVDLP